MLFDRCGLTLGAALLAAAAFAQEPVPRSTEAPSFVCGTRSQAYPAPDASVGPAGWIVGAEYLHLKACALGGDYAYATRPGQGPAGTLSARELGLQPARDAAFRVIVGHRDAEGYDAVVRWLNFHGAATDAAAPTGQQALLASRLRPQDVPLLFNGADAAISVNVNALDLERGLTLEVDDRLTVRGFFGARYLNLRRGFESRYYGPGPTGRVAEHSHFDGFGPRIGFDSERRLRGPWGMYAKGGASLLAGRMSDCSSEAAGPNSTFVTQRLDDRIVPGLEMSAGLVYRKGLVRMVAGYEIQQWFGATAGVRFLDGGTTAIPELRDLALRGLMLRAEVGY